MKNNTISTDTAKTSSMKNSSIFGTMEKHHRHCDTFLVESEEQIHQSDWMRVEGAFQKFEKLTLLHFDVEEGILFPPLEAHMGHGMGPVAVMKQEHEWIRQQLEEMKRSIQEKDKKKFFKHSETCHLLLQQHNMKEEHILYPMIDQLLGDQIDSLLPQIVHQLNKE